MKIYDLICNREFDFNVHYCIYHYDGPEDETTLIFDSESESDLPKDIMFEDITAINQADNGIVEIEYI